MRMLKDFHGMLLLKQLVLAGQIRSFSSALPLVQLLKKPLRNLFGRKDKKNQYTGNESCMN